MSRLSQWTAPAAVLLSIVAIYSAPEVGGFAMAALVCWGLAIVFEERT